jgi:hypothetical protein
MASFENFTNSTTALTAKLVPKASTSCRPPWARCSFAFLLYYYYLFSLNLPNGRVWTRLRMDKVPAGLEALMRSEPAGAHPKVTPELLLTLFSDRYESRSGRPLPLPPRMPEGLVERRWRGRRWWWRRRRRRRGRRGAVGGYQDEGRHGPPPTRLGLPLAIQRFLWVVLNDRLAVCLVECSSGSWAHREQI